MNGARQWRGSDVQQDLVVRVRVLEEKVQALEELPARVTSIEMQIVQLRTEMRDEFSAVRAEIRAGDYALREEMRDGNEQLRRDMVDVNDRTLTQMRVLHEEVLERIAKLDEGRRARKRRR
jgi:hypothetical protein